MVQHTPWERFAITLDRASELGLNLQQRILILAQAAQVASGFRSTRLSLEAFVCIGDTASLLLEATHNPPPAA